MTISEIPATHTTECWRCDDYTDCGSCDGMGEDSGGYMCGSCFGSGMWVPAHCCICGLLVDETDGCSDSYQCACGA